MQEYYVPIKSSLIKSGLHLHLLGVVAVMATYAEGWKFYPFKLAEACGLDEASMIECLADLSKKGLVRREVETQNGVFKCAYYKLSRDRVLYSVEEEACS